MFEWREQVADPVGEDVSTAAARRLQQIGGNAPYKQGVTLPADVAEIVVTVRRAQGGSGLA
jgi:hypothetical protein